MTILSDRGDHLELDRDRRRKCAHLNRGARWIGLARSAEIFRVKPVIDREILFHIREKYRDIDDVLPCCAGVFQNEPHVFENRAALRFDVITDDVAGRIECDTGNFLAAALARANAREKQKFAPTFRMRKRTYRFRRARTLEGFTHFLFVMRDRLFLAQLLRAPRQHFRRENGIVFVDCDRVRIKMAPFVPRGPLEDAHGFSVAVDL